MVDHKDWDKYITTPHLDQSYSPVSTNGILNSNELVKAYYKINASFAKLNLLQDMGKGICESEILHNRDLIRIKNQELSVSLLWWRLLKENSSDAGSSAR